MSLEGVAGFNRHVLLGFALVVFDSELEIFTSAADISEGD